MRTGHRLQRRPLAARRDDRGWSLACGQNSECPHSTPFHPSFHPSLAFHVRFSDFQTILSLAVPV